jgi:hypothetical protein
MARNLSLLIDMKIFSIQIVLITYLHSKKGEILEFTFVTNMLRHFAVKNTSGMPF